MPRGVYIRTPEYILKMKKATKGMINSGQFKKGQKPLSFKGGYTSKHGYVFIYKPEHPFAMGRKRYVMEHRLVMEEKIGRYLKPTEIIHHINGNPSDNRIENLKLCVDNTEHRILHVKKHKTNKKCTICKNIKSLKKFPFRLNDPDSRIRYRRYSSWCYDCCNLKKRLKRRTLSNSLC